MAIDEARVRQLAEQYETLKQRQQALLDELKDVQQRMGEIMLQIIDVTRE
jgi:predicted  nucleic acid-binding Zn-ribbon protein